MNIFVGQIYIRPGISFPFTIRFQRWLGDALSKRVDVSEAFCKTYGPDFSLGLRISAKAAIYQPEINGPTVFKSDKTVEFTIFLPHRSEDHYEPQNSLVLLRQVVQAVDRVLRDLDLDASRLLSDSSVLETEFLNTPGLLDKSKASIPVVRVHTKSGGQRMSNDI